MIFVHFGLFNWFNKKITFWYKCLLPFLKCRNRHAQHGRWYRKLQQFDNCIMNHVFVCNRYPLPGLSPNNFIFVCHEYFCILVYLILLYHISGQSCIWKYTDINRYLIVTNWASLEPVNRYIWPSNLGLMSPNIKMQNLMQSLTIVTLSNQYSNFK